MPKAKVNGVNINYKVYGQGEPLVLIMGIGGDQRGWIFQTLAFKKYYKVITFDNRGIGKSDKPRSPYTIKTMADDTIGLMDHLGIDKAHILGISMGGMIAQEIAINYPERVMKLILGCTTGTVDIAEWGERIDSKALESLRDAGLEEDFSKEDLINIIDNRDRIMDEKGGSVDVGKMMTSMMSSIVSLAFSSRLMRAFIVPISKIYFKFGGSDGIVGQFRAIMTHDTLDRLHEIKATTLVITGTEDVLVPPHFSEEIVSKIPDARLVKVDGGSHMFSFEMRKRFNKEILDFLRGS